uniref:SDR family NAD(P)-dependent oxidoreductase n=1 Tax=Piscinibacter sp. TaxID=1903157 RepID=UPI003784B68A
MGQPVVLVTGGAKRVGAAIVRAAHAAGARVVVHCNRSRGEADRLAARLETLTREADSAVMLNAKLKPGATLLHVIAMTRSIGERLSASCASCSPPGACVGCSCAAVVGATPWAESSGSRESSSTSP